MRLISSCSSSRLLSGFFPEDQATQRPHRQRYILARRWPQTRPWGFASRGNPAPGSARSAAPPSPGRGRPRHPAAPPPVSTPAGNSGSCVAYREGSAIYIYSSGLFLSEWHFEAPPRELGGCGGHTAAHRGAFASRRSLRERERGGGVRCGEGRKKTHKSEERQNAEAGGRKQSWRGAMGRE